MFGLVGKYIRALKREIQAKDELINAQDNLIHNLSKQLRLRDRIEDIDKDKLRLWVTPCGNTLIVYPQTKNYLRSLGDKLSLEREYNEILDLHRSSTRRAPTVNQIYRELKEMPGIVW